MTDTWDNETPFIENIHKLYFRVVTDLIFDTSYDTKLIKPRAFYNTPPTGSNMSTDWEKYSTPQHTLDFILKLYKRGTTDFRNNNNFSVVSFLVSDIKEIDSNHRVLHDPVQHIPERIGLEPNNRAHTLIEGKVSEDKEDAVEVRAKFVEYAKIEILQK